MNLYTRMGIVGWPKHLQYALLGSLAAGYNVLLVGKPGSNKTRFIKSLGALLGLRTRIYDVDKLNFETLVGEINPDFVGQTAKALHRAADSIQVAAGGGGDFSQVEGKPEGQQFINSVCDYELIGWDEILRGDPATQQSLLLNVMQDKTFQGRDVKAMQISCTNTDFDELYEFNEALLNRYHLIFQCPSFLDLPSDTQDELIGKAGHNKELETIEFDPEFTQMFKELQGFMARPPNPELDGLVKHFVRHLKHPLGVALEDRLSGRAIDNTIKVLYVTMLAHLAIEKVRFQSLNMEDMRGLLRDTFLSTIYLNDLTAEQLNQVRNSFHLAFLYTFDIEELSLRDRLLSVPNFLVNCEDFVNHIENVPTEKQDIGGIAVFVDRLKKECKNNKPLRYILYKWFLNKIDGKDIKIEADLLDPIKNQLAKMESSMAEFTKSRANISLETDTMSAEFLKKLQQSAADKIFSSMDVDTSLYAGLVTTIICFDPDKAREDDDYVQELYTTYASLKRI